MSAVTPRKTELIKKLEQILGQGRVLTDEASCVLYAQDIYTKDLPAMAVVSPGCTEELAACVAAVAEGGHAVIARGGGMSYTSGYVPKEVGSVIVDMQEMNRVLDVNTDDMYVTVEAGCTWKTLHEALGGTGYRTPFWGTLSGIHATVGGGLSQNSIFWGSTRYGTAADTVLGVEVVLADGTVVATGSGASQQASRFFRHYGPDLTGLFCSDTGALGFKATASLRLVSECEYREQLSFNFPDYPGLIAAMNAVGRAGIADECFAFDPNLQAVRMQRESLMSDVRKLGGVLKSGKSVLGAFKEGAKVAIAGRGFMKDVKYSMHVMVEQRYAEATKAATSEVRRICSENGGNEIENSIGKIIRANPFTPLNNITGPSGERWVPVHAIIPHSKAKATMDAIGELFERHEALMQKHGIGHGYLLATISTNGFVIEPVLITPDSLNELHKATVESSILKKMPCFESRPEARAATARIRKDLIEVFRKTGGVHMQIGKAYPYRESLRPESWRLVEAIKNSVDPGRRVNPGALGLGTCRK